MINRIYTAVKIFTQPMNSELITGIFELLQAEGIEEIENGITAYFKEFDKTKEHELKLFFDRMKHELLIEDYLFTIDTLQNQNWNEEWEKTIEPIKVSEKFVIKPSFKDYIPRENEIVLTIDPKMSFGTGYHQSTRLMIKLIEKYISPGMKVLDVGTGTGVLAIASAKLGAEKVVAVENDEVCIENANENFVKNETENRCEFILGHITNVEENNFDLVLANINKHILFEIVSEIKKRLKTSGIVILSGIVESDEEGIIMHYTSLGFRLLEKMSEDEWLGLALRV